MPKRGEHCGLMVSVPAGEGDTRPVHEPDKPHGFVKLNPIQFDNCGPRLGRNVLVTTSIPIGSDLSAQIFQSRIAASKNNVGIAPNSA
jgi:hypothetical protein